MASRFHIRRIIIRNVWVTSIKHWISFYKSHVWFESKSLGDRKLLEVRSLLGKQDQKSHIVRKTPTVIFQTVTHWTIVVGTHPNISPQVWILRNKIPDSSSNSFDKCPVTHFLIGTESISHHVHSTWCKCQHSHDITTCSELNMIVWFSKEIICKLRKKEVHKASNQKRKTSLPGSLD